MTNLTRLAGVWSFAYFGDHYLLPSANYNLGTS